LFEIYWAYENADSETISRNKTKKAIRFAFFLISSGILPSKKLYYIIQH
jgi:hypothetical protein